MDESKKCLPRAEQEHTVCRRAERLTEEKAYESLSADQKFKHAPDNLEEMVALRTSELEISNQRLRAEIEEYKKSSAEWLVLYKQTQEHLVRTEALYRVSRLLVTTDGFDSILHSLVDGVVDAVQSDLVQLYHIDFEAEKILHFFSSGPGSKVTNAASCEELRQGLSGWAMRQRKPAISPKDQEDLRESEMVRAARRRNQAGAILVVPLIHQGKILGTLTAINRFDQRDFTEADADLMMAMASHAAAVIFNVQLVEKMKQARLAAESANQAKSRFLTNMSHELRTPLNGILGYTQILSRDRSLPSRVHEAIDIIHQSGEHLLTLINDILDLSKIEAEKMELAPVEFHLQDFLTTVAGIINVRAQQKGIGFEFQTGPSLPVAICADERRLRQVLLNILGNAVKFTDAGSVKFTVGRYYNRIRFQVEDTGVGISAENLNAIFEPFRQAGDVQAQVEGTGLGLAISSRLIELMGGQLLVESRLGGGSRFWFDLNLESVNWSNASTTTGERQIVGYRGKRRRVLITDDSFGNRVVLRDLLEPLGFAIKETVNGRDAVKITSIFRPHLILMDLVMPVMDGFDAIAAIRKLDLGYDPAIVAISASIFELTKEHCQTVDCDDYLIKPMDLDQLLDTIEALIDVEWVYEDERAGSDSLNDGREARMLFPSAKLLADFHSLILIGDMDALIVRVNALLEERPEYAEFGNRVTTFAREFRLDELQGLIERRLEVDN
ncbi:MAG: response regulator [Caldilineaceae bacterium]|nr:response regulator [Caldilineaceae bacterium]